MAGQHLIAHVAGTQLVYEVVGTGPPLVFTTFGGVKT